MSPKNFYITTPLYYVNAKPHIGHAYTNVLCDTFARWKKLTGQPVFFLTGTDEHGTKIEKTAKADGKEPREYVDGMIPAFKELWKILGIEYDYFIRTTDEGHKKAVGNVLRDLETRGEIYKSSYTGWYCTPCESFWTELQLVQGKCPDCQREVQQLSEENYFFKLSKYQEWLIEYINAHPGFIRPEIRKNEILGFLRQPLEDLCISRLRSRLQWGIDYPTSKDHVVYVWFDALVNYVSAIGYTVDEKKFKSLWPADLHLVGKDILRQHAVYWPIMLKACGLEMPETVLAHGWWTMSGAKVSKSRGNAVDPIELVKKYTVDAFRYFMMREVTIGFDGAFSEDLLAERYTTDLANDLGNLWFRVSSMIEKYFEGKLPAAALGAGENPYALSLELFKQVSGSMKNYDPREALSFIWAVLKAGNQYVENQKPWALAKDPAKKGDLAFTLLALAEAMAHVAVLLRAFMPETASKILAGLKLPSGLKIQTEADFKKPLLSPGTLIDKGTPLFPRLEDEEKK
jgi:methionyl-tRNA synthetase